MCHLHRVGERSDETLSIGYRQNRNDFALGQDQTTNAGLGILQLFFVLRVYIFFRNRCYETPRNFGVIDSTHDDFTLFNDQNLSKGYRTVFEVGLSIPRIC